MSRVVRKVATALFIIITLIGCGEYPLYDMIISTSDNRWSSGACDDFIYNNEEVCEGNIYLLVNHDGVDADARIELEVMSPDSIMWSQELTLQLDSQSRDSSGWCKNAFRVVESAEFGAVGEYKFTVRQISATDIKGVNQIGIVIKKEG